MEHCLKKNQVYNLIYIYIYIVDFEMISMKCENVIDVMIFKILDDLKNDLLSINQLITENSCIIF